MVTIRGTLGEDTLLGRNSESNSLFGDLGNDTLRGGSRADFLQGNHGSDFIVGGDGGDTLYGGKGDDTLYGGNNVGIDTVEGGVFVIRDSALNDADILYGDLGNDVIQGNAGRDTLFGSDGADTINGGRDGDSVEGGAGDDRIMGDRGDDTLQGNAGRDVLEGGAGNDLLRGGQGDDILIGGDGQDTLYGDLSGASGDTIFTGNGDDLIIIRLNDSNPVIGLRTPYALASTAQTTITDFKLGDRIIFEGGASSNITITNSAQSTQTNPSTIIEIGGQSFMLNGITANQISTNNITLGAEVVFAAPSNNGGGGGGGNPPAAVAPTNTLPATYTTNEDANLVLSGISVADSDTASPASFIISTTNGILNILDNVAGGLVAGQIAGNGSTTITITGATLTQINATLLDANGITFVPTTDYNGSATVTVTTNDGALSDTDTSTITINPINDAPVLSDVGASTAYIQNETAVVIDASATIVDVDDTNIESATVAITAGGDFVAAGGIDALNYSTLHGVTGVYDPATGILTLTGSATRAQYEAIIESVTFSSTSATTGNRTISYTLYDGTDNSNTQTATINYSLIASLTGLLTDQNTTANQAANAWTFDASTAFGGGGTYSLTTTDQLGNTVTGYSINATTGIITNSSTIANTTTAYIFTVTKTGGGTTVTENFDLFTNAGALTGTATTGADTITASANSQRIWADSGNDSLNIAFTSDTVHAGDGNDTINLGNTGVAYGGAGDDSIISNYGNTIWGGDGNDTVTTVTAGYINLIYGGAGTDSLNGNIGAADTINGGSGDDTITGSTGADSITGGTGNDYFTFGSYADSTTTGRDTITDFTAGDKINMLFFDGFGAGDEQLTATFDGTNTIVTANSAIGGVTFSFALTGDVTALMTNAGIITSAQFNGTVGADTLTATANGQTFFGDSGNDSLNIHLTSDTVHGGDGNDTIGIGDQGVAFGGAGNDSIISQFRNTILGGDGNDTVTVAQSFINTNLIYGGTGTDSITANSGNDTINGGSGDDTITAAVGADSLTGGTGADRFRYTISTESTTASKDIITDFSQSDGDLIDLSPISSNITWIGTSAFSSVANQARYYQSGGNTFLQLDTNGDGTADLEIQLNGLITLVNTDILGAIPATLTGLLTDQNTTANQAASAWTFDASTAFGGGGTYSLTTTDQLGNTVTGYSINATTGIITNSSTIANTTTAYIFTVTRTGGGSTVTENFDLFTNAAALTGTATTGVDTLTATADNQILWGNNGNDSITYTGVPQNYTVHGGDGNDTINIRNQGIAYAGAGDDSIISQNQNTIFGGDGNDTVVQGVGNILLAYGGVGIDSISANASTDTIDGGSGDDTITGAGGGDSLSGGTGNDVFVFAAHTNSTTTARDTITDFNAGDRLNILPFVGGFGVGANQLTATFDGTNTIVTANTAGDDGTIFSFRLNGNVTALMVDANIVTSAQFNGTAGADTLTATLSSQTFFGDAGNDSISFSGGPINNTIHGGDGNDTIYISHIGIAYGGAGDDSILSQFQNTIFGGDGNDTILQIAGNISLLYGGAGADRITGNFGNDTIDGGSGDDTITGDRGTELLTGGVGNDYFVFAAHTHSTTTARDTITDFAAGDVLNILPFVGGFGVGANQLTAIFDGTNTIVTANTAGDDGTIFSFRLNGNVTALMIDANIVTSAQFNGTAGNDTLTATASSQTLFGDAGNDSITFTSAPDFNIMHGGGGNDTINIRHVGIAYGGADDDSIVSQYTSTIFGGDGNDTVNASTLGATHTSLIYGGIGNDSITTNATTAIDTIYGGSGSDTITGAVGADNIFAGASDGAIDRIIYSATTHGAAAGANTGQDTIAEFEVGTDKIAFTSTINTSFDDIGLDDTFAWVTNAAANFTTTAEGMLITGLANSDLTQASFTNILTALNVYGITAASGADAIIVAQGATQTAFYLYTENGTLANNIVSAELTLLGISNGQLTTSDFIFA